MDVLRIAQVDLTINSLLHICSVWALTVRVSDGGVQAACTQPGVSRTRNSIAD